MSTQDALLADILAKPDDDLPRLALCDWWDEFGTDAEKVRSEFVRVQVELARRDREGLAGQRCDQLRKREWELFNDNCDRWFKNPPLRHVSWHVVTDRFDPTPEASAWVVRRGFVSEVRCRLADWCGWECHQCAGTGRSFPIDGPSIPCRRCGGSLVTGIGPEVMRRHPVEKVVLTDREPSFAYGGRCWFFGSRTESDVLTRELLGAMEGEHTTPTTDSKCYPTDEAAHAALSAALIAWAKVGAFNADAYHPHPQAAPLMASMHDGEPLEDADTCEGLHAE